MQPSHRLSSGSLRALRRLPQFFVPAAAALCLCAGPAAAANPAVIVKVHPASGLVSPYFQIAAAPGGTVAAGSLEVVNPTGQAVTARLDPVDALTTSTLGSGYAMRGAAHGPATWLRLGRPSVTIAPHASETVPVAVAVPQAAAPGDYLAGVAVEALGQSRTAGAKGLLIGETDRYAIGVEVSLPGPRNPLLELTGARLVREPAGLVFLVAARNAGNEILKDVHGSVRVSSGSRLVAAATVAPGTFVDGTSIEYPVPALREQPEEGAVYRVRAELHYGTRAVRLDTNVVFSHAAAVTQQRYGGRKLRRPTPWWVWALTGLAALAALAALVAYLRRRRRPLSRAAGVRLLERLLAGGSEPVSVLLVEADGRTARQLADAVRPDLRRADRVCELQPERLLVIAPGTGPRAAAALHDALHEHFARHPELADAPVRIAHTTCGSSRSIAAAELLEEAAAAIAPAAAAARRDATAVSSP